jgi:predicted dehydrogenase
MSDGHPVRVGVIGTGAISQVVHVPIFAEREDVERVPWT